MKNILLSLIMLNLFLPASESEANSTQSETDKQLAKQMQREKKYAEEQVFYTEKNYDFKGAEVSEETLKHIEVIEVEEFDMDDVYD
jgi:sortase (surface protein transpeptidase)